MTRPRQPKGHRLLAERVVWEGTAATSQESWQLGSSRAGPPSLPLGVRVHSLWEAAGPVRLSPGSVANCPDNKVAASWHLAEGEGRAGQWAEAPGSPRSPLSFQASGAWVGPGSSHGLAFPVLCLLLSVSQGQCIGTKEEVGPKGGLSSHREARAGRVVRILGSQTRCPGVRL